MENVISYLQSLTVYANILSFHYWQQIESKINFEEYLAHKKNRNVCTHEFHLNSHLSLVDVLCQPNESVRFLYKNQRHPHTLWYIDNVQSSTFCNSMKQSYDRKIYERGLTI